METENRMRFPVKKKRIEQHDTRHIKCYMESPYDDLCSKTAAVDGLMDVFLWCKRMSVRQVWNASDCLMSHDRFNMEILIDIL